MVEDNRALEETGGTLFPGVNELVPRLAATLPLFIVSNCQAGYIEVFLKTSGLGALFVNFECWGNTGRNKAENRVRSSRETGSGRPGSSATPRAMAWPLATTACASHTQAYGFGTVTDSDERLDAFTEVARLVDLSGVARLVDV